MSSSDRVTRLLAEQAAAKAAKTAADAREAADRARRANPKPHKVDAKVLRAPAAKRGR